MKYDLRPDPRQLPGQRPNDAGGFGWTVSDTERLERFLIMGSATSTFYASGDKLLQENLDAIERLIEKDPLRVWNRTKEVSDLGLALKNSPALVVAAMLMNAKSPIVSIVSHELPVVARTLSHLYEFVEYTLQRGRGWGRAMKRAVTTWLDSRDADSLAYQAAKYQRRNGWTLRDLLRLSHYRTNDQAKNAVIRWALKGEVTLLTPEPILTMDALSALPFDIMAELVRHARLTREMVPSEYLNQPDVMEALLENMPPTATLRTLGLYAAANLHAHNQPSLQITRHRLVNLEPRDRIHPMSIYLALRVYRSGKGVRGGKTWAPSGQVIDALNTAFERAFQGQQPFGKKILVAVDTSGSMGGTLSGDLPITAHDAACAVAYILRRCDRENVDVVGIDTRVHTDDGFSRARSIDHLISLMPGHGGATYLHELYRWALHLKLRYDAVVLLTDSQWNGAGNPEDTLAEYRKFAPGCKQIVAAMADNEWTMANPKDGLSFNIVGFSADLPQMVAALVK